MKKLNIGILFVIATLALVSVVSADLPSPVTGYLTWNYGHVSTPDYFHVDITSGGNPDLPVAQGYKGWCVDEATPIYVPGTYPFQVYSSLNNPGPFPGVSAEWDKINYILNHKGSAKWPAVQAAIWHYSTSSAGTGVIPSDWFVYDANGVYHGYQYYDGIEADYNALIADAEVHGHNYVPTCGSYAVVLYASGYQVILIEKELPVCDPIPAPEFPTFALPAALLIGFVGAVYLIKVQEK